MLSPDSIGSYIVFSIEAQWGSRGREFDSRHSDHKTNDFTLEIVGFLFIGWLHLVLTTILTTMPTILSGLCGFDFEWWPGGIFEEYGWKPWTRNLNECWILLFFNWWCPAFVIWCCAINFNGIFILLQFSLRLFYLFHANLYAHG